MTGSAGSGDSLLATDALKGIRIAISASESADLGRLGLVETHFRLALAEISRSVLVSGGKLAYGGHLDPNGYTALLSQELHRYGRRDRPLQICLAWQEHRRLSAEEFDRHKRDLGLFGEIVCLDPEGHVVEWSSGRGTDPQPVHDDPLCRQSLTALRNYMASTTNGRVLIGGRRRGFSGALPGVLEEALISIKHGQPLYLAGGFGGVTSDIVTALGVDDGSWIPAAPNGLRPDERLVDGLKQVSVLASAANWKGLENGLTVDENKQLAVTPRPQKSQRWLA